MSTVGWLEVEGEEPDHVEREDQEVETVEVEETVAGTIVGLGTAAVGAAKIAKTVRVAVVCSCGLTRCGAIRVFGLPRPVFAAEIQPIPSQYQRDQRARVLRQTL